MLDQSSRRSPDHSTVAGTVLVIHADKAGIDCPADKNEDKKLDFDRLEVIKHKKEEDGIAADTQNFLNQQIRRSMSKLYGYGWCVFVNWCHNNQLDPKAYKSKTVLKFLVEHNHL
ncbi:hypothetical protein RMATCC62417_01836 [Rhizopus microsporus]|nr:hypothetical protein RMATCC62417_01836 [Rhizopus microsporus]